MYDDVRKEPFHYIDRERFIVHTGTTRKNEENGEANDGGPVRLEFAPRLANASLRNDSHFNQVAVKNNSFPVQLLELRFGKIKRLTRSSKKQLSARKNQYLSSSKTRFLKCTLRRTFSFKQTNEAPLNRAFLDQNGND